MPQPIQIKRTPTPGQAPTGLLPGELAVEMAAPTKLWVGVPTTVDPSGQKLLIAEGQFVETIGDTMTGILEIAAPDAYLKLDGVTNAGIGFEQNNVPRWTLQAVDDFSLLRFDDAGAPVNSPLVIDRATGSTYLEGNLTVSKSGFVQLAINSSTAQQRQIAMTTNGVPRWVLEAGADAEAGANTGSNFRLYNCDDAGTVLGTPLLVDRATGVVSAPSNWAALPKDVVTLDYLQWQSAQPGAFVAKTGDTMSGDLTLPACYSNSGMFISLNASQSILGANGAPVLLRPNYATGAGDVSIDVAGNLVASYGTITSKGYTTRAGFSGAQGGNRFNINWNATAQAELWIDDTNLGPIAFGGGGWVLKAGDVMTGDLTINRASANTGYLFYGITGAVYFGFDGTSMVAQGARFVPNGGITTPADIYATGGITSAASVVSTGALFTNSNILYMDNPTNAHYLQWDGANYNLGGAGFIWHSGNFNPGAYQPAGAYVPVAGGVTMTGILYHGSGAYYFNSNGDVSGLTGYFAGAVNAAAFNTGGHTATGTLHANGTLGAAGAITGSGYSNFPAGLSAAASITSGWVHSTGTCNVDSSIDIVGNTKGGTGYICRDGTAWGFIGNVFNFSWDGQIKAYIDANMVGYIAMTSDYRIKKDIQPLPSMWETVKALRPIKYTRAEYSPANHRTLVFPPKKSIDADGKVTEMPADDQPEPRPFVSADEIERWGFIAHELQETLIMSAATGVKDSPDIIQSPDPWTIIAALTSTLQEALRRIETLEGAAR